MENICKKMVETAGGAGALHDSARKSDAAQYIPSAVAHELNNIIAIIRGYTDKLLVKHSQDPALEPQLKLISDAARRAGLVVREAMAPKPIPTRLSPPPPPPSPA